MENKPPTHAEIAALAEVGLAALRRLGFEPDHDARLCSSPSYAAKIAGLNLDWIATYEDPTIEHQAAARVALAKDGGPDWADDTDARDKLARATFDAVAELRRRLGKPPENDAEALELVDVPGGAILRWDAVLADYAAELGGTRSAEIRKAARERVADQLVEPSLPEVRPAPGRLWILWTDDHPENDRAPRWLVNLARAVWPRVRGRLERDRQHFSGMPLPLFRAKIALSGARVGRSWTEDGEVRAKLDGLDDLDVQLSADAVLGRGRGGGVALSEDDAKLLLDRNLSLLNRVTGWRLLDLVMRTLDAETRAHPDAPSSWTPKLVLPGGRALAEALGMARNGANGTDADDLVRALAAFGIKDSNGGLQRIILSPERIAHAPGRPAQWLVTPGEVIRPTFVRRQARHVPEWRRLVPWADEMPPDDFTSRPADAAAAVRLGIGTTILWRDAAGAGNGATWLDRDRSVCLDRATFAELAARSHASMIDRTAAFQAWEREGWATVKGDLVQPGPALPRLVRALDDAAENARAARARKKPGKKAGK